MPLGSTSPRSAAAGVGVGRAGSVAASSGDDRTKTTAKWGAACASCAAAKAKCIRSNEESGSKCDRCERLFKDCTDQVHRPRKKRASKPSKTAQLEERLNGLVDLLRATGELSTSVAAAAGVSTGAPSTAGHTDSASADSPDNRSSVPSVPSAPSSMSVPSPDISNIRDDYPERHARDRQPRDVRRETEPNTTPATIPATYNSFAPPACICRPEIGDTVTDAVESDAVLLDKFRTKMQPLVPIVVLPEAATAAQLAVDRPFLFLSIKTVASVDNYRSMQGLMFQLINHLSDYMLLRAERSLDLLQGLLTILSWYHHHCMMHSQLSNLLHLASSLVGDLGLGKPARIAERTDLMVLHPNPPSPRTHEERRALLGLWYLRSSVALCFQKSEPMRFTPYMRQCLHELEAAADASSDATLVALVRMQQLAEKVGACNSRDDAGCGGGGGGDTDEALYGTAYPAYPAYPRAPKAAYKIAFQSELDQLLASLAPAVRAHAVVESHARALTLRLYEPPLLDLPLLRTLSSSLTSALTAASSPTRATALDMLYRARTALTAFFDQFFTVSIHIYQWLPLPLYVHLIYGITMLSRWARLIGPTRPAHANLRGPALNKAAVDTPASSNSTTPASAEPASATTDAASASTPTLDLRDPSHRLVPGQGAAATKPGVSGISGIAGIAGPGGRGPVSSMPFAFIPGMDPRELQRDPSLLQAVARLRDHMRLQPDLQLDIPATLTTIWDRFEQSNREMRAAGAAKFGDSVARGMNVWDLTARKIAIMRFKVGRYLDGATAGAIGGAGSEASSAGGAVGAANVGNAGIAGNAAGGGTMDHHSRTTQHTHTPTTSAIAQPPQRPKPTFSPYPPYAQHMYMTNIPGQHQQQQHQQHQQQQTPPSQTQLPLHTASMAFGSSTPMHTQPQTQPDAQMPAVAAAGLPPDMGYAMGAGAGAAAGGTPGMGGIGNGLGSVADISYGLGNLEGWDHDPLWGADLFGTGPDPAMWAENMDWVATLG
ncbi:hypothetical protein HMPREF1624_07419 [Sporothrix schenckii ATCC 58251]|uniref:Zn(2)-C6 fungal-type domain-containing protein n=1 Tax=Sporothrix schenckii (strain ATCC 58251 / de Perez 2211183) TaxID=1391915 RepID=U7PLJ0_SPOS1|nr:hypothetical protein HMPREF1624_07419 [Sporothrix schenckii ATCC 58251]